MVHSDLMIVRYNNNLKVGDHFIKYNNFIKNIFKTSIKYLHTDQWSEYLGTNYLNEQGIEHLTISGYASQENGMAEKWNDTLSRGIKTNLESSRLQDTYWEYAMKYYFRNTQVFHFEVGW